MEPLPMVACCSLDGEGLQVQLARYRKSGKRARLLERDRRVLSVELAEGVDRELVSQAVAVERECCPFFEIEWEPEVARLRFTVGDAEHEPALEAIAYALGLDGADAG